MTDLVPLNDMMNGGIRKLLEQAGRVHVSSPPLAAFMLRSMRHQARAAALRTSWEKLGTHVPPFLIVSVTNRCNLGCKGCYSAAQHRPKEGELTEARFRRLLEECTELGVSFALLAGGEPLVRPEILQVAKSFPHILFPVFTNGVLIDDAVLDLISSSRNLIPIVSLEGDGLTTDERRGEGVYARILSSMAAMRPRGIFSGLSITVTRANLSQVTSPAFVKELVDKGSRLFFYVEYVAADEASGELALSQDDRLALNLSLAALRRSHPAVFIAFPGDEAEVGGCLAAGRGFVHISARGEVEPCPFTPWSDTNLSNTSLRDALASPLLATIRDHHEELKETSGGCALWAKREWVQSLLAAQPEAQHPEAQPQGRAEVSG